MRFGNITPHLLTNQYLFDVAPKWDFDSVMRYVNGDSEEPKVKDNLPS